MSAIQWTICSPQFPATSTFNTRNTWLQERLVIYQSKINIGQLVFCLLCPKYLKNLKVRNFQIILIISFLNSNAISEKTLVYNIAFFWSGINQKTQLIKARFLVHFWVIWRYPFLLWKWFKVTFWIENKKQKLNCHIAHGRILYLVSCKALF